MAEADWEEVKNFGKRQTKSRALKTSQPQPQKINEKQQVANEYEARKAVRNQQLLPKLARNMAGEPDVQPLQPQTPALQTNDGSQYCNNHNRKAATPNVGSPANEVPETNLQSPIYLLIMITIWGPHKVADLICQMDVALKKSFFRKRVKEALEETDIKKRTKAILGPDCLKKIHPWLSEKFGGIKEKRTTVTVKNKELREKAEDFLICNKHFFTVLAMMRNILVHFSEKNLEKLQIVIDGDIKFYDYPENVIRYFEQSERFPGFIVLLFDIITSAYPCKKDRDQVLQF